MTKKLTSPSEENYLEWLYRFSKDGPVRSSDLAKKLGIKQPSVTRAISTLKKKGLVRHEPRGILELTEEGEALGKAIVQRDKCLTDLLVKVLDMPPATADMEVHRLEHVLSDDVLVRLEALVEFAVSSPAWLKRLHLRVNHSPQPEPSGGRFFVGQTPIHSGLPQEKGTQAGRSSVLA
jgi:Mn-dependent DtxR family transcriptional regulator